MQLVSFPFIIASLLWLSACFGSLFGCNLMVIPPVPNLFLKGESREMAFYGSVSQARLKKVSRVGSGSVYNVVEHIIGEKYLQGSGRTRVNAEIASVFVFNLLAIGKNKEETLLIACHMIHSKHAVGLDEEVVNFSMPSAFFQAAVEGEPNLDAWARMAELTRRNAVLLEFAMPVHKVCKMKGSGPASIHTLDLDSLIAPIGHVPPLLAQLLKKGKSSYVFLLKAAKAVEVGRRYSLRKRKVDSMDAGEVGEEKQVVPDAKVKVEFIDLSD
ncbi:hypothetical protein KI387_015526 [Taxus chinensis]|uniref:Uncharacterized protein n=1 Tax=Taxus chinensis TaxID=29808 RepID=A0AA38LHF3_TAXCH|nr:hypothetical protein KI387_015526 [Taxus chinensis]